MALAETAALAVDLNLHGNYVAGMTEAEAASARFNTTAATAGTHATTVSTGFARIETAAGKVGGALSHAGSQIKNLVTGPLGLLGLGAGLFSVAGGIERGLTKAQEFGDTVRQLGRLTGDSAESVSSLSAAMEHFGVAASTQTRLVGFLEKNVGLLASKQDGLANFTKTYGLALTDQNGKIKDANALILTTADYFNNKAIPATEKAAALSKLYGRSWQELIPFLAAGRQGIQDAEEEAQRLGLTLTKDNVDALAKMKAATRELGTAVGGLELQIGLALVPALTDLADEAAKFVSGHRTDIVNFFKNAVQAAKNVAGTIGDLAGTFGHFWSSIPEGFRDLLVKGFVADRTVKFLFGFDPIKTLGSALLGSGGIFSRGGSPANPLWVQQVGLGGGGGSDLITTVVKIAAAAAVPVAISYASSGADINDLLNPHITTPQERTNLVNRVPAPFGINLFGAPPLVTAPTGPLYTGVAALKAPLTAAAAIMGANARALVTIGAGLAGLASDLRPLARLDTRLQHSLLPHSWVNHELQTALRIAKSSESTDQKIKDLEKINRDLVAGGHKTAHYVQDLINVEKRKKTSVHITIPISISSQNRVYRVSATGRTVSDGMTNSVSGRGVVTI
jgi:hypothetical protein